MVMPHTQASTSNRLANAGGEPTDEPRLILIRISLHNRGEFASELRGARQNLEALYCAR